MRQRLRILFALVNVTAPVWFVWHTELMNHHDVFRNGFLAFDPLQVYHVLMYAVFACSVAASYLILTDSLRGGLDRNAE